MMGKNKCFKNNESKAALKNQLRSKEPYELLNELDALAEEMSEYDFDEELVVEYIEVLQEKAPLAMEEFDIDESFEEFKEEYGLLFEAAISDSPKPKWIYQKRFHAASVVAAAACLVFFILLVPKDAYGNSFLDKIINWGEEVISIKRLPPGGQMLLPVGSESEYRSLAEALEKNGIPSTSCPTWIPAGYSLTEVLTSNSESSKNYLAIYKNGDSSIQFVVQYDLSQSMIMVVEKDPEGSVYVSQGYEFYILANMGVIKAVWVDDYVTYQVSGNISIDDIKTMLDSIKERR